MKQPVDQTENEFTITGLLPNVLTLMAICAGLTAIRFGFRGDYVTAVQLIMAAGVLDGLDGRLARLLKSESKMGAELDSLADFLNFGVAPALVVYVWTLQEVRGGWICALFFAICCVLRLARFNVGNDNNDANDGSFFEGVPAPAGALLVMLPMYVSFAFIEAPIVPGVAVCAYLILIGLLLISRIPVWSFKKTRISRENAKYFLVGVAVAVAALLTFSWITLIVLCVAYVFYVVGAWVRVRRS